MCLKIYKLDPTHFLSALALAWQACLKKTEVKLELLADINILLMTENSHAIYRYAKAKNNYKIKESLYLMHLDVNNLFRWTMSQKLPVNGFKWKENMSVFDKKL